MGLPIVQLLSGSNPKSMSYNVQTLIDGKGGMWYRLNPI